LSFTAAANCLHEIFCKTCLLEVVSIAPDLSSLAWGDSKMAMSFSSSATVALYVSPPAKHRNARQGQHCKNHVPLRSRWLINTHTNWPYKSANESSVAISPLMTSSSASNGDVRNKALVNADRDVNESAMATTCCK
jgi:hypothetical protein